MYTFFISLEYIEAVRERLGDEKQFMLDIVSNAKTSIDVDKFDYLLRDSYHTGKACGTAACVRTTFSSLSSLSLSLSLFLSLSFSLSLKLLLSFFNCE